MTWANALSFAEKGQKIELIRSSIAALEARLRTILDNGGMIPADDVAPLLHSVEAMQIALTALEDDRNNHPQHWR